VWNAQEYAQRLQAQDRGQLVEAIAWFGDVPGGRGMVLFPEHEELSTSAVREGCAEVRDVFVARPRRRLGVATALMAMLEEAVRDRGAEIDSVALARRRPPRERSTSGWGTSTRTGRSSRAPT
jgi:GNAT superfamily N-acetyltransferase